MTAWGPCRLEKHEGGGKDVGVARTGAAAAKKRLARVLYRLHEYQEKVKAPSDISAQDQVDDSQGESQTVSLASPSYHKLRAKLHKR